MSNVCPEADEYSCQKYYLEGEIEHLRAINEKLLEALQGLVGGVTVEVEEVALLTDALDAIAAVKGET
jgi:hypothetical protein